MITHYKSKSARRKTRLRAKLKKISDRLRLSVFRSNKYIYAQIIDDKKGKTLVSASEKDLKLGKGKTKTERAKLVGEILAQKAKKAKIKKVVFDRGAYKFHGRVAALAGSLRKGGLDF